MKLRNLWLVLLLVSRSAWAQDTPRDTVPPGYPNLTRLARPARFRDLVDVATDSVRALRTALNEYYDRCTEAAAPAGGPVVDAVGQDGASWIVHVAPGREGLDGDMLIWVHKTSGAVTKIKRWC
jgi:hypothetical protein